MEKNWTSLPFLDFSHWTGSGPEKSGFLKELREIAHTIGFFYLTGHGISGETIRKLLTNARKFFELPISEKLKMEMIHSPHFRGYSRVGAERTLGLPDWREQIDIGAEKAAILNGKNSPLWSILQGPNQWPEGFPEFQEIVIEYQKSVTDLAIRLTHAFAESLGQKKEIFDPVLGPNAHQLMKIIRYPGRNETDSDQGVGAHKDGGFVTVLLQDIQAGLEVEYEGNWIHVPPIQDTFVINIGELLELASNGYLRATVHRALTPPPGTDRISVGFFYSARLDLQVPLLELPQELSEGVRGLTKDPNNPLFYEVGKNLVKSRFRSHPDVAERHHSHLLDSLF
ncbi:isopenicillin N synthase family dioxygenase [Leptospira sarikeiensis]|uniref:2-oxoglutarate-dependent ethylene/succinate-forming enzyme n=1 Tax=Leptospira sarikeiensis TaxID=2484943 RepID=A0A4R9JYS9_9LEPT|nr:2-oxoglutarate and iron-dependent oxygenase domain-containing protein [Leptospira sarikeiensis]TGL58410.1 isopenicillin N synthase family oxygenase [Leptospira sarikeiensis]